MTVRSIILLLILSSCTYSTEVEIPQSQTSDLGPLPTIEASTFENIFIVDENKCQNWNLPITRFKIEYPNNVKVDTAKIGADNYDYISFQIIENDIVIEEFSVGYTDCKRAFEKEVGEKSAEQTLTNLRQSFPNTIVHFNEMGDFFGQRNYLLQAEINIKNKTPQKFLGTYQILKTHYYPKQSKFNPVNLSWTANQQSEIKSKSDFGVKGLSAEIWKTFEFIE